MGKKTFASAQVKNKDTGQWETVSREFLPDDLVMYALLQDLLHGFQLQTVNLFLSQSSTEDRRVVLDRITGYVKDFYQQGSNAPGAISSITESGPDGDVGCIPPLM